MISVNNLSLSRRHKCLISGINLQLNAGEKVALLGANGAGKSTLLKCLSGEINDYQGDVLFQQRGQQKEQQKEQEKEQQDIRTYPSQQRAKQLAVMPQKVELTFPFKVAQVVAMGRMPHGDEHISQDIITNAMSLTDVLALAQRNYASLSGGEQQRVQLARVLAQIWQRDSEPERAANHTSRCLLLDECTSALDPAHQHSIMQTAAKFADQGVAVLAVMHDIALAASWAQRVIILKDGQLLAEGGVSLLADADIMQQAYGLDSALAEHYASQNQYWLNAG